MELEANIRPSSRQLRIEFGALYVLAPLGVAVVLPPERMFTALFALTGLGIFLLHRTHRFRWAELLDRAGSVSLRIVGGVAVTTALAAYCIVSLTAPGALFALPLQSPQLMVMIALGYPILSALPQELVFRPLFFRRYDAILPPAQNTQIILNAALFSLAHAMYWSWIVAVMTFAGGLVFAWSYRGRGNFAEAVLTHSVAGVILFAFGMGVYFYSGAVERPF